MGTMSLIGGIDLYSLERYKSNISPEGRKVIYLDENGYDIERGRASKLFKKGTELTVKEIFVGRSSSTVEFVEYPEYQFNTVMFTDKNTGNQPVC
jgi:hypothetical protein